MAALGIENLANPRKKTKTENLGGHGVRHHPSNVNSRNAVNFVNQPVFDFPDDVITNILSFLPIKQAVQASSVSERFNQSWFFSRKLCFDKDFAKRHSQKDFMDIINHVLDLHVGLAKVTYKITSDFADVKTVKILKLCRIDLDLLPTFQGLESLRTLVLRRIDIKSESIETMVIKCLSLETLELVKCRKIGNLRILLNGYSFEPHQQYWNEYQHALVEGDYRPLKCLEFIKMVGFKFEEHEIEIVKYLLERPIVLNALVLAAPKTVKQGIIHVRNIPLCTTICERCPVSPLAKIHFYDHDHEDNSAIPKHSKTWFEK
ncbi:hypothetical protein REPUB_Repub13aG0254200 [Reevesia pubescens]